MSADLYASSIATTIDLGGRAWAAWNENGRVMLAGWDGQAQRWNEAIPIGNAGQAQNLRLLAAPVLAGGELPALVASWESGQGNDKAVYLAIGSYQANGSVRWSDSVRLGEPGLSYSNHQIGLSDKGEIVITAESQLINNETYAPEPGDGQETKQTIASGKTYSDKEISTYRVIPLRSNTYDINSKRDGSRIVVDQASEQLPISLRGSDLVELQVNGQQILSQLRSNGSITIAQLGTFSVGDQQLVDFAPVRSGLKSDVVVSTAQVVDGSLQRRSLLLQPKQNANNELKQGSDTELRIYKDDNANYTNVVLSYANAERAKRTTASTFQAFVPRNVGLNARELTGGGFFSDEAAAETERLLQEASKQEEPAPSKRLLKTSDITRAQSSVASGVDPVDRQLATDNEESGFLAKQLWNNFFGFGSYPYILYPGMTSRFEISVGDVTRAMMGNTVSLRAIGDKLSPALQFNLGGNIGLQKLADDATKSNVIQFNSGFYFEVIAESGIGGGAGSKTQGESAGLGRSGGPGFLGGGAKYVRGVHSGRSYRYLTSRQANGFKEDTRGALDLYKNERFSDGYDNPYYNKYTSAQDARGVGDISQSKYSSSAFCGQADWGFTAGTLFGVPGLKGLRLGIDGYQRYLQRPSLSVSSLSAQRRRWDISFESLWSVGYQVRLGMMGRGLMPAALEGGNMADDANNATSYTVSSTAYTQNDTATIMYFSANANLDATLGVYGGRTYDKPKSDASGSAKTVDLADLPVEFVDTKNFRSAKIRPPFGSEKFWSWLWLAGVIGPSAIKGFGNYKGGNFNSAKGLIPMNAGGHEYGFTNDFYSGYGFKPNNLTQQETADRTIQYKSRIDSSLNWLQGANLAGGLLQKFSELPWWTAAWKNLFPGNDFVDNYYEDYASQGGVKWSAGVTAEVAVFNRSIGAYGSAKVEGRLGGGATSGSDVSVQGSYELGFILAGLRQSFLSSQINWYGNDLPPSKLLSTVAKSQVQRQKWPETAIALEARAYAQDGANQDPWQKRDLLLESVAAILPNEGKAFNPIRLSAELKALEQPNLVVIEGVLTLPSLGSESEDRLKVLKDLQLSLQLQGPARLWLDRRALAPTIDEALSDQQPWTLVVDGSTPNSRTSVTSALPSQQAARSGQPVPFRLELLQPGRSPQSADATDATLGLGFRTSSLNGGAASAFAIDGFGSQMPASPELRNDTGNPYILGADVGDLQARRGLISTQQPYVGAIAVSKAGDGFSSSDFIVTPEVGKTIHGRLKVGLSGQVVQVELLSTAESAVFRQQRTWSEDDLQVRLPDTQGGRDALIEIQAQSSRQPAKEPASDATSAIAIVAQGAGYLAGRTGDFVQRVKSVDGLSTLLVSVSVRGGKVVGVLPLEPIESFQKKGARFVFNNRAPGAGQDLELRLITRDLKDNNFVDETHNRISSQSVWSDNTFKGDVLLTYTQQGEEKAKPINSGKNIDLNLNLPLVTKMFGRPNSGWNELGAIKPEKDGYTPGINGYNYGAVTTPVYLGGSTNRKVQLMVFSHTDLSAIKNPSDLYLLKPALQRSKLYFSLYDNTNWATPLPLPGQIKGVNNAAIVQPWLIGQEGFNKGFFGQPSDEVLAAWVASDDNAKTSIFAARGQLTRIDEMHWDTPSRIDLPVAVESNNVTNLSLTYLNEQTPVLSWSLDTKMPYAATVYEDNPSYYYRLDDIDSPLLTTGTVQTSVTGLIPLSALSKYASPFDEEPSLSAKGEALYNVFGALERPIAEGSPGDSNAAMRFTGGEFVLASNPKLGVVMDQATPEAPVNKGYGVEFWFASNPKDTFASLVDEGLYQSKAKVPAANEVRLPIEAQRIPATNDQGVKGYTYLIGLPKQVSAKLGQDGLDKDGVGSNLSALNLSFRSAELKDQQFRFKSTTQDKVVTLTIPAFDFTPFVDASLDQGRLMALDSRETDLPITSVFVADPSSPGEQKAPKLEISNNRIDVGIATGQTPGWSIRKKVVKGDEVVVYTFGETLDAKTGVKSPLSLEAPVRRDQWNHVYVEYSQRNGGQASLYINGELASQSKPNIDKQVFEPTTSQIAVAYGADTKLDELAFYDDALPFPEQSLKRRIEARYIDPESASKNTFYSQASVNPSTKQWQWSEAQQFSYLNTIPATTPAELKEIGVDGLGFGLKGGLVPDGQQDNHYRLLYTLPQDLKAGTRLRGLRVTLANGDVYVLGQGPRELARNGVYSPGPQGLINLTSNGVQLNSGGELNDLNTAVMAGRLELDLHLQARSEAGAGQQAGDIIKTELWFQDPDQLSKGLIRTPVVLSDRNAALSRNSTVVGEGPEGSDHSAYLTRKPLSLAEIETGVTYNLVPKSQATNEDRLMRSMTVHQSDSSDKTKSPDLIAFSYPELKLVDGTAFSQVLILPFTQDEQTQKGLQAIKTLRQSAKSTVKQLDDQGLKAISIVGSTTQLSSEQMLWADLDGDSRPELIIGSASANNNHGQVIVISGREIERIRSLSSPYQRIIDLSGDNYKDVAANAERILYLDQPTAGASQLGISLAKGQLGGQGPGSDLAIGAPGYSVASGSGGKTAALGAVLLLKRDPNLFKANSAPELKVLSKGSDLNKLDATLQLDPYSSGASHGNTTSTKAEANSLRFGESLTVLPSREKGVADDLVIGAPGLVQNIKLIKGRHSVFGLDLADALTKMRTTAQPNSNPPDEEYVSVVSGSMLMLNGSSNYQVDQALLLQADSYDGTDTESGAALSSGDFDGDGVDDLAFGMPAYDNRAGAIAVLSGLSLKDALKNRASNKGLFQAFANAAFFVPGVRASEQLGRFLSMRGSLNGDSPDDLIIGNPDANAGNGSLHVIFGEENIIAADPTKRPDESSSEFQVAGMRIHELDRTDPERRLDVDSGTTQTRLGELFAVADVNSPRGNQQAQVERGLNKAKDLIVATSKSESDLSVIWGKQKLKYTGNLSLKDLASTEGLQFNSELPRNLIDDNRPIVQMLGDINADGYSDLLIGLSNANNRATLSFAYGSADDTKGDHPDAGVGGQATLDLTPLVSGVKTFEGSATTWRLIQAAPAALVPNGSLKNLLVSFANTPGAGSTARSENRLGLIANSIALTSNAMFQNQATIQWVEGSLDVFAKNSLREGEKLFPGQRLVSIDGSCEALMSEDGSFKIFRHTVQGKELLFDITNILTSSDSAQSLNQTKRILPENVPGSYVVLDKGFLTYVRPDASRTVLMSKTLNSIQPSPKGVFYGSQFVVKKDPDSGNLASTSFVLSNSGQYSVLQAGELLVDSGLSAAVTSAPGAPIDMKSINSFDVIGPATIAASSGRSNLSGLLVKLQGSYERGILGFIVAKSLRVDVVAEFKQFQSVLAAQSTYSARISTELVAACRAIDAGKLPGLLPFQQNDLTVNNNNLDVLIAALQAIDASLAPLFTQFLSDRNSAFRFLPLKVSSKAPINLTASTISLGDSNGNGARELLVSSPQGNLYRAQLTVQDLKLDSNAEPSASPSPLSLLALENVQTSGRLAAEPNPVEQPWMNVKTVWSPRSIWLEGMATPYSGYDTNNRINALPDGSVDKTNYPYFYNPATGRSTLTSGDYKTSLFSFKATQVNNDSRKGWGGPEIRDVATSGSDAGLPNLFYAPKDYTNDTDRLTGSMTFNGQYLDQSLLHIVKPFAKSSVGRTSLKIGSGDVTSYLKSNRSWEIKLPALVYAKPRFESDGYYFAMHLGESDSTNIASASISAKNGQKPLNGIDGFALLYDQGNGSLQVYWNGVCVWQLGKGMSEKDLSLLTQGRESSFANAQITKDSSNWLEKWLRPSEFLAPNDYATQSGELWSMAIQARYQASDHQEGKGMLYLQLADSTFVRFRESGKSVQDRMAPIMGLDVAIPVDAPVFSDSSQPLQLNFGGGSGTPSNRSDGLGGVQAIKEITFNTDLPEEGLNLLSTVNVGDLNGDGFDDVVGLGTLDLGWNYKYTSNSKTRDLARFNIKDDSDGRWDRGLYKDSGTFYSLRGEGIRSDALNSAVVLWGGRDGYKPDQGTPIFFDPQSSANDYFADREQIKIRSAGDVNLDGFNDLLLADLSSGSTFVLFGSPGLKTHRTTVPNFNQFFPTTKADSFLVNLETRTNGGPGLNKSTGLKPSFAAADVTFQGIDLATVLAPTTQSNPSLPYYGGVFATEIKGLNPSSNLSGLNLSAGGDFNGDGFSDYFVSSIAIKDLNLEPSDKQTRFDSFALFGADFTRSQSQTGTVGQDVLEGGPFNDVLNGREANDILKGRGGADALFGGTGDDVLMLDDDRFVRLDGGSGVDQLILQGQRNQSWDFTKIAHRISGIEVLSCENYGNNQLTLNAASLRHLLADGSNLTVVADKGSRRPLEQVVEWLKLRLQSTSSADLVKPWLSGLVKQLGESTSGYGDLLWVYSGLVKTLTDQAFAAIAKVDFNQVPLESRDWMFAADERLWRNQAVQTFKSSLQDFLDTANPGFLPAFDKLEGSLRQWVDQDLQTSIRRYVTDRMKAIYSRIAADEMQRNPIRFNYPSVSDKTIAAWTDLVLSAVRDRLSTYSDDFTQFEKLLLDLPRQFDTVRLTDEFSLRQSGAPSSGQRFSYYSVIGGTDQIAIPDTALVIVDPGASKTLTPAPILVPTKPLQAVSPASGHSQNALPVVASGSAPQGSRSDAEIYVDAPLVNSADNNVVFTFTRVGNDAQTQRVVYETGLDDASFIKPTKDVVTFQPGELRKVVTLPLLPRQSDAFDRAQLERIDIQARLLPSESSPPATTPPVTRVGGRAGHTRSLPGLTGQATRTPFLGDAMTAGTRSGLQSTALKRVTPGAGAQGLLHSDGSRLLSPSVNRTSGLQSVDLTVGNDPQPLPLLGLGSVGPAW